MFRVSNRGSPPPAKAISAIAVAKFWRDTVAGYCSRPANKLMFSSDDGQFVPDGEADQQCFSVTSGRDNRAVGYEEIGDHCDTNFVRNWDKQWRVRQRMV